MKYYPPIGSVDENAPYIDANPSVGVEGSPVPAGSIEFPQREIINAIIAAELEPDGNNNGQLAEAIEIMVARGSSVGGFIHLVSMSTTAPSGAFVDGDRYYNTASKQIFTWASGAWGNAASPEYGHMYEYSTDFYVWNGSDLKISPDLAPLWEAINSKANIDLGNVSLPHVVETWKSSDGLSWYRQWSDGWIEQGGIVLVNAAITTVSLLKSMKDKNYDVSALVRYTSGAQTTVVINPTTITTTSFQLTGTSAFTGYNWSVRGYANE